MKKITNEQKIEKLVDEIKRIQYHLSHPYTSTENFEKYHKVVRDNKKEIARLNREIERTAE